MFHAYVSSCVLQATRSACDEEMWEPRPLLQSSKQRLVDEMMEGYVTWREACAMVETS